MLVVLLSCNIIYINVPVSSELFVNNYVHFVTVLKGCMSEQITEDDFDVGLYENENKIDPRFVGTVMEIDVSNVVSISNILN